MYVSVVVFLRFAGWNDVFGDSGVENLDFALVFYNFGGPDGGS